MKVLNIYLTQIYAYMESSGHITNDPNSTGYKRFINFAENLGYPEFGLQEGIRLGDFSYLPNSDLIGFNDLDSNILLNLPTDVNDFIKKNIPDFYYQILITLSLKDNDNLGVMFTRVIEYLRFLRNSKIHNPIQRDYDFLSYVIDFISKPSFFIKFLNKVEEDEDRTLYLWKSFLREIVIFSSEFEKCKKLAAQIIVATTKYEYDENLQGEILSRNWKGYISDKVIKSIKSDSPSFIEIGSCSTFFSVREDDRKTNEALDKLLLVLPRVRVIFPEIDYVNLDKSTFYKRKVLTVAYNSFGDIKKKTFNTLFSTLLNPFNEDTTADKFNDLVLNSLESVILIDGVLGKSSISENNCSDIDKL